VLRPRIAVLLVAWLFLGVSRQGEATENSQVLRLDLGQAVALALADNPDLSLSRQRLASAAIGVEAARGQFLPSLQASAGGSENLLHVAAPGAADEYQNANLQISGDLNLFKGFADRAGLKASRSQLQAADADLLRRRQSVVFDVASRFIAVLIDAELVQVAAQNLQSQQALEQQIEAFNQAGVRAETDLFQQQAATAQAEFALLDAQRNLQVDQFLLLQVLGRTPTTRVEALPANTQALDETLKNLDPAQIYAQALAARPDLLAQQQQIAAAQQEIRVAKAGFLPSLDLQAKAGTSYSSAASGSFGGQFDDNGGASFGLSLSIPLFDRHQTRTNIAQAQIGEADATTNLHKLQQQIGLEVGQALADFQRAESQLVSIGHQLNYARQALAASQARYQVGAATWIETSNARTVLVQAQGDEVRARYGVLRQGLNIGYSRGDLDRLLNLLTTKETSS
jgi:outer membrane protein